LVLSDIPPYHPSQQFIPLVRKLLLPLLELLLLIFKELFQLDHLLLVALLLGDWRPPRASPPLPLHDHLRRLLLHHLRLFFWLLFFFYWLLLIFFVLFLSHRFVFFVGQRKQVVLILGIAQQTLLVILPDAHLLLGVLRIQLLEHGHLLPFGHPLHVHLPSLGLELLVTGQT